MRNTVNDFFGANASTVQIFVFGRSIFQNYFIYQEWSLHPLEPILQPFALLGRDRFIPYVNICIQLKEESVTCK